MGKQKSKKKIPKEDGNGGGEEPGMIWVDPERVRFQHARIRSYFSSCGRALTETLDEIRAGKIQASDLPPIQVLIGPVDPVDGQRWYFSLNNRRLWVLKRCREEGLLGGDNQQIRVRVRTPKSAAEAERYSLANCAVQAKVMRESSSGRKKETAAVVGSSDIVDGSSDTGSLVAAAGDEDKNGNANAGVKIYDMNSPPSSDDDDDDDDDDESSAEAALSNRFSALF